MSTRRTAMPSAPSRRSREAALAASARRRRSGWVVGLILLVALAGTVVGLHLHARSSGGTSGPVAAVGGLAPDGNFTPVSGPDRTIAGLRGRPTLIWFVATWCSSCQTGTQAMAANINRFKAAGVDVEELELYQNLGQSGPGIQQFGRANAGQEYNSPNWQFGTASSLLTRRYDPKAYLDIYYLIDRNGKIVYVNGSPGATMPALLAQVGKLG